MARAPYIASFASNNATGASATAWIYPEPNGMVPHVIENPTDVHEMPIPGTWILEWWNDEKKIASYRVSTITTPELFNGAKD